MAHACVEEALSNLGGLLNATSAKTNLALLRSVREQLREVGVQLKAAAADGKTSSEVAVEQEAVVQEAIAKFARRFDASQAELKQAKEQIAQLHGLLPKGHATHNAHRPAPGAPTIAAAGVKAPLRRIPADVGSSMAGRHGGRVFESAEYKSSAPSPTRPLAVRR